MAEYPIDAVQLVDHTESPCEEPIGDCLDDDTSIVPVFEAFGHSHDHTTIKIKYHYHQAQQSLKNQTRKFELLLELES